MKRETANSTQFVSLCALVEPHLWQRKPAACNHSNSGLKLLTLRPIRVCHYPAFWGGDWKSCPCSHKRDGATATISQLLQRLPNSGADLLRACRAPWHISPGLPAPITLHTQLHIVPVTRLASISCPHKTLAESGG